MQLNLLVSMNIPRPVLFYINFIVDIEFRQVRPAVPNDFGHILHEICEVWNDCKFLC